MTALPTDAEKADLRTMFAAAYGAVRAGEDAAAVVAARFPPEMAQRRPDLVALARDVVAGYARDHAELARLRARRA